VDLDDLLEQESRRGGDPAWLAADTRIPGRNPRSDRPANVLRLRHGRRHVQPDDSGADEQGSANSGGPRVRRSARHGQGYGGIFSQARRFRLFCVALTGFARVRTLRDSAAGSSALCQTGVTSA